MNMQKSRFSSIAFAVLALFLAIPSGAQEAVLDSTLLGKDILALLPSKEKGGKADVKVFQSNAVMAAMRRHIAANPSRNVTGYRIRIYNDNKQNARGASESALARFKGMYPEISAYRTYSNPFFKVTVGDFRTRSEALRILQQVKGSFPAAFIVKESIQYPALSSR